MTGMPKASVLPVPVRAWPIRSVPIRATDRVISWMAKGVSMPTRSRAVAISGSTPSSRKVVRILPFCVEVGVRARGVNGACRRLPGGRLPAPVYRYAPPMTEIAQPVPADEPPPAPGPDAFGDIPVAFQDPGYRAAVVDLLGAIAYGEISAFERLAEDARLAPTLEDKVAIATMASAEFVKVAALHTRIRELGADPFVAMAPFRDPIDLFHEHTAPSDWF